MPPWWVVGLIRLWVMEVCFPAVGFVMLIRKHWIGSSKAREPALAVNILNSIKDKRHQLKKNIVVDNNTTTIAKVKN